MLYAGYKHKESSNSVGFQRQNAVWILAYVSASCQKKNWEGIMKIKENDMLSCFRLQVYQNK